MTDHFSPELGLYYRANEFSEDRPTLVFVHGVSGSSSTWWAYEAGFEARYNIVFFDLRGHGRSAKYPRPEDYTLERFSDDLHRLFDHLAIEKAVLVSHSFGTVVALHYLVRHRDRVSATVFLSPVFEVGSRGGTRIAKPLVRAAGAVGRFSRKREPGRHIDYSNYANTGDWSPRRVGADVVNTGVAIFLYCLRTSLEGADDGYLGRVAVPTLIVHGRDDSICPLRYSVDSAKKIPHAKFVTLDDADHNLVLNRPAAVRREIDAFLDELAVPVRA